MRERVTVWRHLVKIGKMFKIFYLITMPSYGKFLSSLIN